MFLRCESFEPPMSQLGRDRRISLLRNRSALHAEIGKEMGQKIGERPDH
jgi:hypothetical protein